MRKKDFEAAKESFARSTDIVARMERAVSPQEIGGLWSEFLVASHRVFSKLAGAATAGRSAAWYGRVKHQRKTDELLMYVHQARHADEHGLERIADPSPGILTFNPLNDGKPALINEVRIVDGLLGKVDASDAFVSFTAANAVLHPVRNEGRTYAPPTSHAGKPWTDNNAQAVSKATLAIMERIIADGETYLED